MPKLPDNFVKPPPATSQLTAGKTAAGKVARRTRTAGKLTPALEAEAAGHVDGVLVRLSTEEHDALSAACAALAAVGHTVSIEDMIKQVIARWIAATRAMQAPVVPGPHIPMSSPPVTAAIRAQLRALAAEPIRRWRLLEAALRRWAQRFELRFGR